MRKFIFLIGAMLVFTLVACNQSTEQVDKKEVDETNQDLAASELTLEEVMEKTIEASDTLKSFSVEMQMDQQISGIDDEEIHFLSHIDMDYVHDPMALHQKMSLELVGEEEAFDTEIYFTEDGIFYYDVTTDQWMKFQEDMLSQLVDLTDHQTNPAHEIKNLKEYAEDLTFDQDEDHYIMNLEASGEKFTQFIKDKVSETMPEGMDLDADIFEKIEINQLSYEILIDKKTFYPATLHLVMELELTEGDEIITVSQELNGTYQDFNSKSTIDIPQEIIDQAVDTGV